MGLRKIIHHEKTTYMHSNVSTKEQISIILLRDDAAYKVKLRVDSNSVIKWSQNLQKTSQQYIELLQKSIENCSLSYSDSKQDEVKEDVFEIQEDCLVWKQFFPDKKVYGRRGRFTLEKVNYEQAVREILDGTISDLQVKSSQIQQLTEDVDNRSKESKEAKALTAKCVMMKKEFENEIYGKCAALLNAKKLKIKQLMRHQPSTSGSSVSCVSRKLLTDTQPASKKPKPVKPRNFDSDGYSSDTDVDDPERDDFDTDEENSCKASTQIQKKKATEMSKPLVKSTVPKRTFDSQDDLFNSSLDAELYSIADVGSKKQKIGGSTSGKMDKKTLEVGNGSLISQNSPTHGKSMANVSKSSLTNEMEDCDTQNSIINELF